MPQKEINKILIIRLSSLGDILLTTPVIRALKMKYPSAQIHFAVRKDFEDAVHFNPYLDRIILYDKNNPLFARRELMHIGYDLIIDLQNNSRSRALSRNLTAVVHRFHKPTFKKLLLVWTKINLLKDFKTISERYAESAAVKLDGKGLELSIPGEVFSRLEDGRKYIGFCPGARHFTKRWPPEYFIELGNSLTKLGYTIVIFGGADEAETCGKINSGIGGSINLQNDNRLLQLAADMKTCTAIVANDSGLMHVAAAVGVPVIAVFGSTVKELGFAPFGVENLVLENKSLSCRPCSHIGKAKCPKKHFKCMMDLTPQIVFSNSQKFLSTL